MLPLSLRFRGTPCRWDTYLLHACLFSLLSVLPGPEARIGRQQPWRTTEDFLVAVDRGEQERGVRRSVLGVLSARLNDLI